MPLQLLPFEVEAWESLRSGVDSDVATNAEVGPDHLAHAVVRNDFIALLITNSERI